MNAAAPTSTSSILIVDPNYHSEIQKQHKDQIRFLTAKYDPKDLDKYIQNLNSQDIIVKHEGLIGIRKLISQQQGCVQRADILIEKGVIPKLVQFLKQKTYPQLILQSAWAVTNILSGSTNQCQEVMKYGIIQIFVQILKQNKPGIVEQIIWGIGNLASDSPKYRDQIVSAGGLDLLVDIVQSSHEYKFIETGTWAITNFCRGVDIQNLQKEKYEKALPLICKVFKNKIVNDSQTISDCLWSLSKISQSYNFYFLELLVKENILDALFETAFSQRNQHIVPSLRILGAFSSSKQSHTEYMMKNDRIFDLAMVRLNSDKNTIKKQMCWVLSNIAGGSKSQASRLMKRTEIFTKLVQILNSGALDNIKKQIFYIFTNLGYTKITEEVLTTYKDCNIMELMINELKNTQNTQFIKILLSLLQNMLSAGEQSPQYGKKIMMKQLQQNGGIAHIENLQYHQSTEIYELVHKIIQKYFDIENQS